MNTSDPERFAYTGWHRPHARARWRAVVEAESEDEAWAMLLAAVAGGDKTVTKSPADPNRPCTGACTRVAM
jgi:hypothetical protein